MGKMKTDFELKGYSGSRTGGIEILGREVIIHMEIGNHSGTLSGKDLERFATNILKALHPVEKVINVGANGRKSKLKK